MKRGFFIFYPNDHQKDQDKAKRQDEKVSNKECPLKMLFQEVLDVTEKKIKGQKNKSNHSGLLKIFKEPKNNTHYQSFGRQVNEHQKESIFQWNRVIMFNKAMEYKEQGKQEKKQGIFSEKIHKQKNNQF